MPSPFDIVTDSAGRIDYFVPVAHPHESIMPEAVTDYLDGSETLERGGVIYSITANGSLVPEALEVPDTVRVASGVILGPRTSFELDGADEGEDGSPRSSALVTIAERARVNSELMHGVRIGPYAVVLARSVGSNTRIGEHNHVQGGTEIGNNVTTGKAVRIDRNCQIHDGVEIGDNARVGYESRILARAQIGRKAKIGVYGGQGPRGNNYGGPFINKGRIVADSEVVED